MKDWKLTGRLMSFLHKRLKELHLEDVDDPRGKKGQRWQMTVFLRATIAGIISGQKNLKEVEALTTDMTPMVRKLLGLKRRVPDTTMRDCFIRLDPDSLRNILHKMAQVANRRKALLPIGLPGGVVAMDGKWSVTNIVDPAYTQHHSDGPKGKPIEQLRTVTSCLISSKAKVCLDAFLIPPATNEKGIFICAFDSLLASYPNLFEIVTYDAGANTKANAEHVDSKGIGYVFGLKADQGTLFDEAKRLLSELPREEALAETTDIVSGKTVKRRLWKTTEIAGYYDWQHLRMVLRVQATIINNETAGIESIEDRYFITNVPVGRMKNSQWLMLVRRHWAVENNCHNIWDRILREDDRVWIREPQGMLAVQLLRRIAFNLMSLFRSCTQRSDEKREMPWKDLMKEFYLAFMRLALADLKNSKIKQVIAASY